MKLRIVLIAIVISGISVGPLFARGGGEAQATGFTQGKIEFVEGFVQINNTPADFGTVVPDGAVVKTEADSYCDIVFGENNVIRLFENTLATIQFSSGELDMKAGSVGAVLNRLSAVVAPDSSRFQVKTPQVVGGVRGTSFYIKVEDVNSSYICACWGKLSLDTRAGFSKAMESAHHKAYHFIQDGDTVRTVEGEMLYHDDASMDAVAGRIGYEIPWGKETY